MWKSVKDDLMIYEILRHKSLNHIKHEIFNEIWWSNGLGHVWTNITTATLDNRLEYHG
jgi:hypothetical protein